jgi:HSP20 family protein
MPEVEAKQETQAAKKDPPAGKESLLFPAGAWGMNPFGLMRQLVEEMDRAFGTSEITANGAVWSPTVEVKEANGNWILTAELPGLKKEDVKVNISGNRLSLEGERKQEKEEKKEGFYRSERSYGRFYRSLTLPEGAKADDAKACYKDGLLEISIPLGAKAAGSRQIPIEEEANAKSASA